MPALCRTVDYGLGINFQKMMLLLRFTLPNLMTRHEQASARLTISIGGWGEEAEKKRKWIYIEARPTAGSYEMMVRQPEESLYHGKPIVGVPMTRTEVLSSDQRREIFEVADYIAFNDPAVKSYLSGEEISVEGRNGNIQ